MKKKTFTVEIESRVTAIKFTKIKVEATNGSKARGIAEYMAEATPDKFEWSNPVNSTKVLLSEIIEKA